MGYLEDIEAIAGRLTLKKTGAFLDALSPGAPERSFRRVEAHLRGIVESVADRSGCASLPLRHSSLTVRPYYPTLMREESLPGPMVPIGPRNSLTFRPGPGGVTAFLQGQLLYADEAILPDPFPSFVRQLAGARTRGDFLHVAAWLYFVAEVRPLLRDGSIRIVPAPVKPALRRDIAAMDAELRSAKAAERLVLLGRMTPEDMEAARARSEGVRFWQRYCEYIDAARAAGLDVDYSIPPWIADVAERPGENRGNALAFRRLRTLAALPGVGLAPLRSDQLAAVRASDAFVDVRSGISRGLQRLAQNGLGTVECSDEASLYREVLLEEAGPPLRKLAAYTREGRIRGAVMDGVERITLGVASGAVSAAVATTSVLPSAAGAGLGGLAGAAWCFVTARSKIRSGDAASAVEEALAAGRDWYVPWDGSVPWPRSRWNSASSGRKRR